MSSSSRLRYVQPESYTPENMSPHISAYSHKLALYSRRAQASCREKNEAVRSYAVARSFSQCEHCEDVRTMTM